MSIELFLYLADILCNIDCYSGLIVCICAIAFIVIAILNFIIWDMEDYEAYEEFKPRRNKFIKCFSVIFIISSAISIFVPGKKTIYAIGFTHYAKQTDIPRKLLDLINQKLDDALNGEKL